jgi:queuosine biosynthesis protein QueD
MFELKILTHFAAAHQLTMVSQKCENLHGHNWRIEVCVTGEKLDDGGVLIDFGVVKAHVAEIIETLDHKFLNELDCFQVAPLIRKYCGLHRPQPAGKNFRKPCPCQPGDGLGVGYRSGKLHSLNTEPPPGVMSQKHLTYCRSGSFLPRQKVMDGASCRQRPSIHPG